MIFRQFNFDGCLSYIIACKEERIGAIIDPSHDIDPYLAFVKENRLNILYVIDTHTHVDHISLTTELAQALDAQTVMSKNTPLQREIGSGVKDLFGIEKIMEVNAEKRVDIYLDEKERLPLGSIFLRVLFTPGHTKDSMSLISNDRIFTGDALIIGQCGRTDLPGGDPADMHDTLFRKLAPLSKDLVVYPAHDYRGNINSSLGYERINNVCINTKRDLPEFAAFLKGLFPPLSADGGRLQCGLTMDKGPAASAGENLNPLMKSFCISMEQYLKSPHESTLIRTGEIRDRIGNKADLFILDVRGSDELSDTGYIEGAVNIPVQQVAERVGELPKDLNTPIAVVCESGIRSAHAAIYLRAYGYNDVTNLEFGMREWRQEGLPVVFPGK
jgi:sulfur dioxygenase